jgi:hypothetical protein
VFASTAYKRDVYQAEDRAAARKERQRKQREDDAGGDQQGGLRAGRGRVITTKKTSTRD